MTVRPVDMIKAAGKALVGVPRPTPAPAPTPSTTLNAAGEAEAEPSELDPVQRDLTEDLPRDIAQLRVVPLEGPDGKPRFRLELSFREHRMATTRPEELKDQMRPGCVLADKLAEITEVSDTAPHSAVAYYDTFSTWCSSLPRLKAWLRRFLHEGEPARCLIVWDDTDFGIPWELFLYQDDENRPRRLGATVQMVRWTMIRDDQRRHHFSAEEARSGGHEVLYFEHRELIKAKWSSIVDPPIWPSYRATPTLKALLELLTDESAAYGLVYVRCHGEHGAGFAAAKLDGIAMMKIDMMQLLALRRSVVFLNACNSARSVVDLSSGTLSPRTFAEIFLRNHAAAVIATLGEVPVPHSAGLARKLLERAAREGEVHMPEELRARRAACATELPPHTIGLDETQRIAIQRLLIECSIVYFGHPDSALVLEDR